MKKLLLISLILLLGINAWAFDYGDDVFVSPAAPEGCPECAVDVTDACTATTNWTTLDGGFATTWNTPCSGSQLYGSSYYGYNAARYNTSVGDACQWAMVSVCDINESGTSNTGGVALRVDTSGNWYYIGINQGTSTTWEVVNASGVVESVASSSSLTWSDGNYIAARVTGTGNNTVIEIWQNPSGGNCPDYWGTADITFMDNPSNACDTGESIGIESYQPGTPVTFFSNFSGGGE